MSRSVSQLVSQSFGLSVSQFFRVEHLTQGLSTRGAFVWRLSLAMTVTWPLARKVGQEHFAGEIGDDVSTVRIEVRMLDVL